MAMSSIDRSPLWPVGVSLFTVFGWHPRTRLTPQLFADLSAVGATLVELVVNGVHNRAEDLVGKRDEVSVWLEDAGLRVSSVTTNLLFRYSPAAQAADLRGRALRVIRDLCRVAAEYGAPSVVVVPGGQERGIAYSETYAAALQTIRTAARYAQAEGVTLAIENVPNDFLQSPREFSQFIEDVDSPAVGACLDLGNVLAANQSYPENWVMALGGRITLVHAKDYLPGYSGAGPRLCGEGGLDWATALDALSRADYRGPLVIETPPGDGESVPLDAGIAAARTGVAWVETCKERRMRQADVARANQ